MSAKPVTKPRWALTGAGADAANVVVPSSGEQDTGWTVGQTPIPSGKLNFLFNWLAKWINFLDDSPNFVPTTTNAAGLVATGNGTGNGLTCTGGATGSGVVGFGGATSGPGVAGQGTGGLEGVRGTGNGVGPGVAGTGGATNAPGIQGTGGATNGNGVNGQGTGTGNGVRGTGGATGPGVVGTGGATSGDGVQGNGTGGGKGGNFSGQGAAAGVGGVGGATGPGVVGTGGATSGDGVQGTGTGGGNGVTGTGQGAGAGLSGTGGATGQGVKATAGGGGTPAKGALNLVPQAAPSAPADGDVWVETTTNVAKTRINGATKTILTLDTQSPTAPTPNANWTAGFGLAYWKDQVGMVHLKGRATAAAGAGNTVFSLPAGFRPASTFVRHFAVARSDNSTVKLGFVNDTGGVGIDPPPVVGEIVSFDGVHFLAEA